MIRVIIADDHELIRDGFSKLVGQETDIELVGEAACARELFALLRNVEADILVLDIGLPDKSGLQVLQELKGSAMKVLVLSMHPEGRYARQALSGGAAGYLTKDSASEELITAIRRIRYRGRYVSQTLAEELAGELHQGSQLPPHYDLSTREYQLLLLFAEGKNGREAAEKLHLSVNTINSYRRRLLKKMRLKNNAELIHYAVRHGLV